MVLFGRQQQNAPPLPEQSGVELNMPPMNGAEYGWPCSQKGAPEDVSGAAFPQHTYVHLCCHWEIAME
ncbi:hypothetical protein ACVXHB_11520 [Escherichia coli]